MLDKKIRNNYCDYFLYLIITIAITFATILLCNVGTLINTAWCLFFLLVLLLGFFLSEIAIVKIFILIGYSVAQGMVIYNSAYMIFQNTNETKSSLSLALGIMIFIAIILMIITNLFKNYSKAGICLISFIICVTIISCVSIILPNFSILGYMILLLFGILVIYEFYKFQLAVERNPNMTRLHILNYVMEMYLNIVLSLPLKCLFIITDIIFNKEKRR